MKTNNSARAQVQVIRGISWEDWAAPDAFASSPEIYASALEAGMFLEQPRGLDQSRFPALDPADWLAPSALVNAPLGRVSVVDAVSTKEADLGNEADVPMKTDLEILIQEAIERVRIAPSSPARKPERAAKPERAWAQSA